MPVIYCTVCSTMSARRAIGEGGGGGLQKNRGKKIDPFSSCWFLKFGYHVTCLLFCEKTSKKLLDKESKYQITARQEQNENRNPASTIPSLTFSGSHPHARLPNRASDKFERRFRGRIRRILWNSTYLTNFFARSRIPPKKKRRFNS